MTFALPTRRSILAAAAAAPLCRSIPCAAGEVVRGRTIQGWPSAKDVGLRATDGMVIRACRFIDIGDGAIKVDQPVKGLVVEQCQAERVYRFLSDAAGSGGSGDASLTDFVFRQILAHDLQRGFFRIRYGSARGLIQDVAAYGSDDAANYCVGFALDGDAHDITYQRAEAHGFIEAHRAANKYWNGDGFSDERGNRAIRYIDCRATDCSDGGFDVKSDGVLLDRCVAQANKRNYRLWNNGRLTNCESHDPKWRGGSGGKSHFSFHGDASHYVFDRPVVRAAEGNTAPVFLFATTTPTTIDIINADIDAPSAPLIEVQGPQPTIRFIPDRSRQRIRTAAEK